MLGAIVFLGCALKQQPEEIDKTMNSKIEDDFPIFPQLLKYDYVSPLDLLAKFILFFYDSYDFFLSL